MAQDIKYYKLSSLPAIPERGAIYFIPNGIGNDVDQYIVDKDGTAFIFVGRTNANALSVSAGVLSGTAGQLNFGNANGVTFGYNPFISQITASINPPSAGMTAGMSNIGNTLGNTGTVTNRLILAGGTNVTLSQQTGLAGNTIYISAGGGSQTVQTQNIHNVSFSGNTSGTLAEVSSGTLIFAGGNNITLSQVGNNVTISGANVGGAQTGLSGLSAGTTFISSGTVSLGNANGMSFGINGQTLTASYTVPTDYISTQLSTLFQHTSLMSNYLGNTYTSHTHSQYLGTDYTSHTHSEYLGTDYTSHTHSQYVNTSATSLFQQTSLMSLSLGTNYTTHTHTQLAQAISGSNGSFTFQTATFGNLNGLSFYTSNGSLVGSYTVPATSSATAMTWEDVNFGADTIGYLSLDYDGTWASNAVGFQLGRNADSATLYGQLPNLSALSSLNVQAFSAGAASSTFQTLSFQDSNGISFSNNAGAIRLTHGLQFTSNTSAITSNALNTSQSSLFQHTSATSAITSNALNTSQSSLFQHTSATSAITSNAVNTSSPRIQGVIGSNTTYTSGSVSFRDLNGITFQSTTGQAFQITHDLQYTSATSAITSNALNTSQSSLFQHTSATSNITSNAVHTSAARIQGIAASNTTYTSGSVTFRDLNGISWQSTTGQQIQITHGLQFTSNTSAITSNALNTSQSSLFQHTSATSAITSNALHSSASRVINIIAATDSTGGGTASLSSNVSFSAANNFTFYTSAGNAIVGSFSQSVDTRKAGTGITTAGNNIGLSGTLNTNGLSLSATVAAQTNQTIGGYFLGNTTGQSSSSTWDARTVSFEGAGLVSVGASAGSIRISATQSNQAFSAGAASSAFQTLSFQDSNGISFSNNAGAIRLTHDLQFTSATSAITANALNTSASRVINILAATNSTGGGTASLSSNVSFSAANGVTFYTSAGNAIVGSVVTSYRASNDAIGLNTAQSNVTWTVNSSGISLDGRGYAGTGTTFNGANISGSLTQNSAGIQMSLSVAAPGAAAENNNHNLLGANTAGNTTASGSTIGLSGINLTLSGTNNSVINISAPATSSLSATGLVSISTNGSTISIGVPGPYTYSGFNPYDDRIKGFTSIGQGSLMLDPQYFPNVQFDRLVLPLNNTNSSNSSGSHTLSFWLGIYTLNVSTLSLLASASSSTNITHSGTAGSYSLYSGMRLFTIPFTTTLTEGQYWLGFISRTTSGGTNGSYSYLGISQLASNFLGHFGSSHNTTYQYTKGQGVYNTTTSAMPASIGFNQIRGSDNGIFRFPALMFASSTV